MDRRLRVAFRSFAFGAMLAVAVSAGCGSQPLTATVPSGGATDGGEVFATVTTEKALPVPTSASTASTAESILTTTESSSESRLSAAARAQADALLVKYGLVAQGEPELLSSGTLEQGDEGFVLYSDLSAAIGLDLASHAGEIAAWFSIPLQQRSEEEGSLSAVFVVQGDQVIGAGLHFRRGSPGVAALNE